MLKRLIYSVFILFFLANSGFAQSIIHLKAQQDKVVLTDTVSVDLLVANTTDLYSLAFDLSYDAQMLEFVNFVEHDVLNNGGQTATKVLFKDKPDSNVVVFGLTRLEKPGVNITGSQSLGTLKFLPKNLGQTILDLNNVGLFNSDNRQTVSVTTTGDTVTIVEENESVDVFLKIGSNVYVDSIFTIHFMSGQAENLFSVATDIVYNTEAFEFVGAIEGSILNADKVNTTFLTRESTQGKIVCGLTRMNSENGGVSVPDNSILFSLQFRALALGSSLLKLENTGFMYPNNLQFGHLNVTETLSVTATDKLAELPQAFINVDDINFENIFVGETRQIHAWLKNTGNAVLNIESVQITGEQSAQFSFSGISASTLVSVGDSLQISFTFTPDSAEQFDAIFQLASDGGDIAIPLSGYGVSPQILVNPNTINFGVLSPDSSEQRTVFVKNDGNAPLSFSSALLEGQGSEQYSFSGVSESTVINAHDSVDILVTYKPIATGIHYAYLNITSDGGEAQVVLRGQCATPQMFVTFSELDFGNVLVGSEKEMTTWLKNVGDAVLILDSVTINVQQSSSFSFAGVSNGLQINPNDSVQIRVTFTPNEAESYNATLSLNSNGGDASISLTGNGVEPGMLVNPTLLDFGNVLTTDTKTLPISIENTGTSNLTVFNIILNGDDANVFQIKEFSPNTVLEPGQSITVQVEFTPIIPGIYEPTIEVSSSIGSNSVVQVYGKCITESLVINPMNLTFTPVSMGQSAQKTVTVQNTGNVQIVVDSLVISGYNPKSFTIQGLPNGTVLEIDEIRPITIVFNPENYGENNAVLTIFSNLGEFSLPLLGYGASADIDVSPDSLDFQTVYMGTSKQLSMTLSNKGTSDLYVNSVSFTNTWGDAFQILGMTSFQVGVGMDENVTVAFVPVTAGLYETQLVIETNVGTFIHKIKGKAVQPDLSLHKNEIVFSETVLDFTAIDSIVLQNIGSTSIFIDDISVKTDEFNVTISKTLLEPTRYAKCRIYFTPQSAITYHDTLTIKSVGANLVCKIPLVGNGIDIRLDIDHSDAAIDENIDFTIDFKTQWRPQSVELNYREGGLASFKKVPFTPNGARYTASLDKATVTLRGLEYYIQFNGAEYSFTHPFSEHLSSPDTLRVTIPEYTYPLEIKPEKYKMISVPFHCKDSTLINIFTDELGEYHPKFWRLFQYDTKNEDYVEYPNFGQFVRPGQAFWYVHRYGKEFSFGESLSTDCTSFDVLLEPGWNQIATPFAFPVNWADVANSEMLTKPAFYDGIQYIYNQTTLVPFEGYFVNNPTADTLTISIPPRQSNQQFNKTLNSFTEMDYYLKLNASIPNSDFMDTQNFIGAASYCSEGDDDYDIEQAPAIGNFLELSIVENGNKYAGNFKTGNQEGNKWNIELDSYPAISENVTIGFENKSSVPAGMEVFVFDLDKERRLALDNNSISVKLSQSGPKHLKIIVGTSSYAQDHADYISLVPSKFQLMQNYPNPFNPKTSINFSISERQHVKLDIFNILGKHVKNLVNTSLSPGDYVRIWDGKNMNGMHVSTGVYIYKLESPSGIISKKMVLLE